MLAAEQTREVSLIKQLSEGCFGGQSNNRKQNSNNQSKKSRRISDLIDKQENHQSGARASARSVLIIERSVKNKYVAYSRYFLLLYSTVNEIQSTGSNLLFLG
jgi:hypothetical protein